MRRMASLALDVAGYFELDARRARAIVTEVGKVVSKWRQEAVEVGLTKPEIERIQPSSIGTWQWRALLEAPCRLMPPRCWG